MRILDRETFKFLKRVRAEVEKETSQEVVQRGRRAVYSAIITTDLDYWEDVHSGMLRNCKYDTAYDKEFSCGVKDILVYLRTFLHDRNRRKEHA